MAAKTANQARTETRAAEMADRKARRNGLLADVLLAPVKAIGLAAAWMFEVLSCINPLLVMVCLLGDE